MKVIDLAELGNSPKRVEVRIPVGEIVLDAENVRLVDEVAFRADVARNEAGVSLKGTIGLKVELDCTRCLNAVPHTTDISFDVNYVSPEQFAAEKEHEIQAVDLETDVLEGDRIDVREIVREQILLDLPEQVFCKPDCKGLCPICGADRNLINCSCEEAEIDPRWAALKNLK